MGYRYPSFLWQQSHLFTLFQILATSLDASDFDHDHPLVPFLREVSIDPGLRYRRNVGLPPLEEAPDHILGGGGRVDSLLPSELPLSSLANGLSPHS